MDPASKRGTIAYLVVVGLSLLWILYQAGAGPFMADHLSAEGVVESVEFVERQLSS
jgi:hypothetical protein